MELDFESYEEDPGDDRDQSGSFELRARDVLDEDQLPGHKKFRTVVNGKKVLRWDVTYSGVSSFERKGDSESLAGADWKLEFDDGEDIELTAAVLVSGTKE